MTKGAVAHFAGPVERVDDCIVDDGEEAIKPEGLALVLNETTRSTFGALVIIRGGGGHSEGGARTTRNAMKKDRGGKRSGIVGEGG